MGQKIECREEQQQRGSSRVVVVEEEEEAGVCGGAVLSGRSSVGSTLAISSLTASSISNGERYSSKDPAGNTDDVVTVTSSSPSVEPSVRREEECQHSHSRGGGKAEAGGERVGVLREGEAPVAVSANAVRPVSVRPTTASPSSPPGRARSGMEEESNANNGNSRSAVSAAEHAAGARAHAGSTRMFAPVSQEGEEVVWRRSPPLPPPHPSPQQLRLLSLLQVSSAAQREASASRSPSPNVVIGTAGVRSSSYHIPDVTLSVSHPPLHPAATPAPQAGGGGVSRNPKRIFRFTYQQHSSSSTDSNATAVPSAVTAAGGGVKSRVAAATGSSSSSVLPEPKWQSNSPYPLGVSQSRSSGGDEDSYTGRDTSGDAAKSSYDAATDSTIAYEGDITFAHH